LPLCGAEFQLSFASTNLPIPGLFHLLRLYFKLNQSLITLWRETMGSLIASLIVGGIAGWLAGMIMKGQGYGVIMNIVIGIIGGVLGGWLFGLFGANLGAGMIGSLITATIGAIILLWIASKIKSK
jgi:uncharacterized membrane protein YeaQ/YmgE (transglycosylase-associated protein family)